LRDVAAKLPLDSLLVETDAPWLAPLPNRGKRNEPSYIRSTAQLWPNCTQFLKKKLPLQPRKTF